MRGRVFLRGPGTEGLPPQTAEFDGPDAAGVYRNDATDWWEDVPAMTITHAEVHLDDGRVVDVPMTFEHNGQRLDKLSLSLHVAPADEHTPRTSWWRKR